MQPNFVETASTSLLMCINILQSIHVVLCVIFLNFYSYAARGSPTYDPYPSRYSRSSSSSRDNSPEQPGKVTFITSFGGDDDEEDDDAKKGKKSEKQSSSSHTTSSSSAKTSSSKARPGSAASSSSSHTPSTDSHSKSWSVYPHSMHFGKRDKNYLEKLKQTQTLAKTMVATSH